MAHNETIAGHFKRIRKAMEKEKPGYVVGEISQEQFIPEHTFAYVIKGLMQVYDGNKVANFKSGECGIARKNRLARYMKEKVDNELEKVFVFFDEDFLKRFQERYKPVIEKFSTKETLVRIPQNHLLPPFISSLLPHYNHGIINQPFTDVKREELLLILLQQQPELSGMLFDFGIPQKINLEAFMNRNYTFNVSVKRFAYLTGRSLSAFKRDFSAIFNETPSHWLIKRRLQEAHFLIEKKGKKPSEIYLDLGFETLSHFSFAFKKEFGISPGNL